tara:strand:- start:186 stop:548 length:363 start_codon:yes stop_codon:yes gene_type:complete
MTMDKNQYKELIAEYMRRETKLKEQVEDLELKLEQQTKDFYFDMRNKQMEVVKLKEENTKLQIALCNLRDEFLDLGGDVNQLELFDKDDVSQLKIFESPDGGETIYQRNAGSDERIKISD